MFKKIALILLTALLILGLTYHQTLIRLYEGFHQNQISKERAKQYILKNGNQIEDITQQLINDPSIPDDLKPPLLSGERKIVIFKYLSDNEMVAGYMSYFTKGHHPVMIFLRGGNGFFGIMRPNNRFSFLNGYNVIGTLYRGNIYGGTDELGGKDINDVENLIRFFPQLEEFSSIPLQPPFTMLGVSRGAMEMFISLSRSNFIKAKVNRAISVSGNVDLNISMNQRPEMKYLFMSTFKKSLSNNFNQWLSERNPADNAPKLSKKLQVLLIYGLSDNRVSLDEQTSFKQALDKAGIPAELITVPNANHGFDNHFDKLEQIIQKIKS